MFYYYSKVSFSDLSNRNMILSRIKDMPASKRTMERRVTSIVANIVKQHTTSLHDAEVISVASDKSLDLNKIPRLVVVARFTEGGKVYEELCCLAPMLINNKRDILLAFVKFLHNQGADLNKVFAVTTDGALAMVEKYRGFDKLLEDRMQCDDEGALNNTTREFMC